MDYFSIISELSSVCKYLYQRFVRSERSDSDPAGDLPAVAAAHAEGCRQVAGLVRAILLSYVSDGGAAGRVRFPVGLPALSAVDRPAFPGRHSPKRLVGVGVCSEDSKQDREGEVLIIQIIVYDHLYALLLVFVEQLV